MKNKKMICMVLAAALTLSISPVSAAVTKSENVSVIVADAETATGGGADVASGGGADVVPATGPSADVTTTTLSTGFRVEFYS